MDTVVTDFWTGRLSANERIESASKTVGQLAHVFANESSRAEMDPTVKVYETQYWKPVVDGTEGGLFWGTSTVYPGEIDGEFFMTRGHFHVVRDRAEIYTTIAGEGMLVLMDEKRHGWGEPMRMGSTHYIPGRMAHRVVNTGNVPLTFLACWPSDAGHDYAALDDRNFSLRVIRRDGVIQVVPQA